MSAFVLRFSTTVLIAIFLICADSESQTSGWEVKGNLKFQIAEIDTIVQHGISVSGDTLWTFCKDSTLYYWDIETGNLINKKKFDDIYRISVDLKSYIYLKQTSAYSIVRYMLRVYNLTNDTLICEDEIINLDITSAMVKTTIYIYGYDYDLHLNKFYFSASRDFSWAREWGNSIVSYIYKLDKDTAYRIDNKVGLGQSFSFSNDLKMIAFTGHSEYNSTMYGYSKSAVVAYHQKGDTVLKVIISYKNGSDNPNTYFMTFSNAHFLNSQNKIAAISYPDIYVWNISSNEQISKFRVENQNPGIFDYCFSHSDEFITYSNNKIYLYDTLSKSKKDSAEIEGINKNISLKHSFKNNKVLFFAVNKFGIFESEFFENNDNPKISYDSNHVYVGKPINFYLLNKNEYEKIEWFSSKGLIGEGKNPTFTFDEPGIESFTVKLTRNGNVTEKTYENLLEILPQLKADFSADKTEGIAPLSVQFTNNSSGNITSYQWEFWDSFGHKYTSTEENPKITFEHDGYYNVRLTIRDKFSNSTQVKTLLISVNKPKINVLLTQASYYKSLGTFVYNNGSKPQIGYVQIYSPGIFILNDFAYLLYTSRSWGNAMGVGLIKFDNDLKPVDSTIAYNSLTYIDHTDLTVTDNQEYLLSSDSFFSNWNIVKNKVDNSNNYVFNTNFKRQQFNSQFNVNFLDSIHLFAFSNSSYSILLKFDKKLQIIRNDTLNTTIIGFTKYSDSLIAIIHKPLNSDILYLKYLNQNLEETSEFIVDVLQMTNIKYILTLPNKHIAFCGYNTVDSLGVVGSINPEGKLDWINKFPNWKQFQRLLNNGNAVYAIGESECFVGFLEFDMKGEKFSHNGFYDRGTTKTLDLDFSNKDKVFLTYNVSGYNALCLALFQFNPLDIKGIQDTTKNPGDKIISNRVKVMPNPAYDEVIFELDTLSEIHFIDIINTTGVRIERIELKSQMLKDIKLNLKSYAVGIYFVVIKTKDDTIKTKFIKL